MVSLLLTLTQVEFLDAQSSDGSPDVTNFIQVHVNSRPALLLLYFFGINLFV